MSEVALGKVESVADSGEGGAGPGGGPAGGGGKHHIARVVGGQLPELAVPFRVLDGGSATGH